MGGILSLNGKNKELEKCKHFFRATITCRNVATGKIGMRVIEDWFWLLAKA